jgi:carbamoylphosphate synthase large subunit
MSTILVTGIGGPVGRNVAALLLERKQRVIGMDMQRLSPEGVSFYQAPPAQDPLLLPTVLAVARKEKVDLIIPTLTAEMLVFSCSWQWSDEFRVLAPAARAVEIANDKYLTSQALCGSKVTVPRFVLPSEVQTPDELKQKIGWPCISKPRVGRSGREVVLHHEEDWPSVKALSDRYILQEFASGTDLAPNLFMGTNGQTVVVVLEKTELKEGIIGNAKSVKRIVAPDVANLATSAAQAVGLNGALDIDIRRRSDGVPLVLEINARFGSNIRFAPEVLDAALKATL